MPGAPNSVLYAPQSYRRTHFGQTNDTHTHNAQGLGNHVMTPVHCTQSCDKGLWIPFRQGASGAALPLHAYSRPIL